MSNGLQKRLGTVEVFAICTGAMVSSGLFILPGLAFGLTGASMILAYVLAGLLCLPALASKAELATAMPKSGGIYFYVDRSMGAAMGTVGGLAAWFSLSLKSAFALVGLGVFIALLFPGLSPTDLRFIAAGLCVAFTIVNLMGVHHAGRSQIYLVFGLLILLAVYAVGAFFSLETERYAPFFTDGGTGFLATTGLVFVSFGGLTKAASVAEEVRDPGRTLPRGMFAAFVVVVVLYALVTFVTVGLVDQQSLSGSLLPLNLGAETALGNPGVIAISIAAIFAFVSTANAGILAASRVPMAMSRDGLLPHSLEHVDQKRGTPTRAILFTGGLMMAAVLLLDLEGLVKVASTLKLLLFILVNVAVILMRESHIQTYRPAFISPLYPWLQLGGIGCYLALIAAMGTLPVVLAAVFVLLSLGWYFLYGREKTGDRVPAWMYVVERIASKDLQSGRLGSELRDIVWERDGIQEDRFDRLVRECQVLEFKEATSMETLFDRAAQALSEQVGMPASELSRRLMERELDTTSVITSNLAVPHAPSLAIPHTAIGKAGQYHLVVARCRDGISFGEDAPAVTAAFVLVVSEDERDFHLRSLMAIAQIAEHPNFAERWGQAASTEDLRDMLLIATRSRGSE